jgi:hypothetical protein
LVHGDAGPVIDAMLVANPTTPTPTQNSLATLVVAVAPELHEDDVPVPLLDLSRMIGPFTSYTQTWPPPLLVTLTVIDE